MRHSTTSGATAPPVVRIRAQARILTYACSRTRKNCSLSFEAVGIEKLRLLQQHNTTSGATAPPVVCTGAHAAAARMQVGTTSLVSLAPLGRKSYAR